MSSKQPQNKIPLKVKKQLGLIKVTHNQYSEIMIANQLLIDFISICEKMFSQTAFFMCPLCSYENNEDCDHTLDVKIRLTGEQLEIKITKEQDEIKAFELIFDQQKSHGYNIIGPLVSQFMKKVHESVHPNDSCQCQFSSEYDIFNTLIQPSFTDIYEQWKMSNPQPQREFQYQLCTDLVASEWHTCHTQFSHGQVMCPLPSTKVTSVEFDISRYGQHTHTLKFETPISILSAVEKVEKYLSLPLTEDYYNLVKDDLFMSELTWENVHEDNTYEIRGDVLTDATFLEGVKVDKEGRLTFSIGS
jgi:hypothetical protein